EHLPSRELAILAAAQPTPQVFFHALGHLREHIVLMNSPKKVFDHLSAGIRVKHKLRLRHPVMLLIHSLEHPLRCPVSSLLLPSPTRCPIQVLFSFRSERSVRV